MCNIPSASASLAAYDKSMNEETLDYGRVLLVLGAVGEFRFTSQFPNSIVSDLSVNSAAVNLVQLSFDDSCFLLPCVKGQASLL